MSDKTSPSGSSVGGLGVSTQPSKSKNKASPSRARSGSRRSSASRSPRSRSHSKSRQGSRVGSRNSSVGSRQSRSSRSFLGGADYGGPVADGNIRILNSIECGGEIFSLRYTEDGTDVCVGLLDGSIKVVNPATSQIINNLSNEETLKDSQPATCIRTKPGQENTNIIGASYASGIVRTWNHDTGEILSTMRDKGEALCLSFNPHINILAVGKGNGEIKLYDEATLKVASILTKSKNPNLIDGHTNKVFCIVNHPTNPQEFLSGGWDGDIHVWDARRPHSVRRFCGPFIAGEGIDIDKKGRELAVACWRGQHQLQVLDYGSGEVMADIEPERQTSYLSCVQYLGRDHLMTGGTDHSIFRVVDLKKKKTVASIRNLGSGILSVDCQKRGHISKIAVNGDTQLNILEFNK